MSLVRILLLIITSTVFGARASDAGNTTTGFRTSMVRPDLFVISGPDDVNTGNIAVYITGQGVVLVDNKFEQHAQAILQEVGTLTDQPVRYVFNTHHHLDHSGSNEVMLRFAEVIAHENARHNMKEPLPSFGSGRPASNLPRLTFKEGMAVHLGGKEVRAYYFGRGHTDGDIIIHFPAEKVIHTGDLYVPGGFLTDYSAGGSALAWDETLRAVLSLDFDTIIPGHVETTVTRDALVQHIRDFEAVRLRIRTIIEAGGSREDISTQLKLDDLAGWSTDPWIPASPNLRRSFEQLFDELKESTE